MESFDVAVAATSIDDATFAWTVPDGWQQGRGAWGGLVVGALARAVMRSERDADRLLRSVSAQLIAPAQAGDHSISVECVRRGTAVSTWTAVLRDNEQRTVALLTAVLGATRDLVEPPNFADWRSSAAPSVPVAADVPSLDLPSFGGPVFMQHLDMRPVEGIPGSGDRPETCGWVALKRSVPVDAAVLVALVDAWWPASLVAMTAMRPIATVGFSANLVCDPLDVPEGPLLHHAFVTGADEGFTSEVRRLWTPDGRLVVDNLQSVVLIA